MYVCVHSSYSVGSNFLWPHGLWPTRLLCPWNFPSKNTGVCCHFLLQGIFPTQGWSHVSCVSCVGRWILYCWVTWESTSCEELTHWKKPWSWERLRSGGEGDDRWWDGWMASSPIQWTWTWANSGRWWRTGKPSVLQSIGLQESDWATEQQHNITQP